jgi:hypothetical protein
LGELAWLEPVLDDDPPPLEEVFPGIRSSRMLGMNIVEMPSPGPQARRLAAEAPQLFSNAQFGVSPPHQELALIVSGYTDLKVEVDVATGTLVDAGARLLLVRDGQANVTPLLAAGTFKLNLRQGKVVSYLLEISDPERRGRVVVQQRSITVLRDVGTTNFEITPEVLKKLAA